MNKDTLMTMVYQLQSASFEAGVYWGQVDYGSGACDEDLLEDLNASYERLAAEVDEITANIKRLVMGEEVQGNND